MTYGYCKKIIASGRYDKNSMKDKLDVFLLAERITDDEYKELMQMGVVSDNGVGLFDGYYQGGLHKNNVK